MATPMVAVVEQYGGGVVGCAVGRWPGMATVVVVV
jgi:hypothetical protein